MEAQRRSTSTTRGDAVAAAARRARAAGRTRGGDGGNGGAGEAEHAPEVSPQVGLGERVRQAGDRFRDLVEERPLAVGAVTLALGLLGGLALPASRQENELLGGKRDELLGEAKRRVRRTVERGKRVARTAVEAAKGDD